MGRIQLQICCCDNQTSCFKRRIRLQSCLRDNQTTELFPGTIRLQSCFLGQSDYRAVSGTIRLQSCFLGYLHNRASCLWNNQTTELYFVRHVRPQSCLLQLGYGTVCAGTINKDASSTIRLLRCCVGHTSGDNYILWACNIPTTSHISTEHN